MLTKGFDITPGGCGKDSAPGITNSSNSPSSSSDSRRHIGPGNSRSAYCLSRSSRSSSKKAIDALSNREGLKTASEHDHGDELVTTIQTLTVHDSSGTRKFASDALPTELWMLICGWVQSQNDLAHLAAVCTYLLPVALEALYTDVTIRSPIALRRFLSTLTIHPLRAQRVRSLTLAWPESTFVPDSIADTLSSVLFALSLAPPSTARLTRVAFNTSEPRSLPAPGSLDFALLVHARLVLPPSTRTLVASTSVLRALAAPRPPLAALSVRARVTELKQVYPLLGPFRASLRRLSVRRVLPWRMRRDSPARVCAELDMPLLEYLEVRDEVSRAKVRAYRLCRMRNIVNLPE